MTGAKTASGANVREAWIDGGRDADHPVSRPRVFGDPLLDEAYRRAYYWSRFKPRPAEPPEDLIARAPDCEEFKRKRAEGERRLRKLEAEWRRERETRRQPNRENA